MSNFLTAHKFNLMMINISHKNSIIHHKNFPLLTISLINSQMLARPHFQRFHQVFLTSSINPHLNLAQELDLLLTSPVNDKILYLWRSTPIVTVGRHQNPYKECDLEYMKNNNVSLVRRTTGGGTFYHDLGHTHWTFIDRHPDPRTNIQIISTALRTLNVTVPICPTVLRGPGRSLLRGTFQFSPTTVPPSRCLRGVVHQPTNLISKGITHEMFSEAVVRAFLEFNGDSKVRYLDEKSIEGEGRVAKRCRELKSHNWLFAKSSGETNLISRNFAFGRFDIAFQFEGPKVKQALVHSDCQVPEIVEKFEDCINLIGRSRLPQNLSQRIYRPVMKSEQEREMTQQLVSWILPEIKKMDFIR
jgi:lipoate-protein ligase A